MPSDASDGYAGIKRTPKKKKARRAPPPRGDVQTGGGYQGVGRDAPVRTGSRGDSAEEQAPRPARVIRTPRSTRPAPKDTKGDSDLERAKRYKRTAAYRKSVRAAYDAASPKERRKILRKSRGREHEIVLKVHRDRMNRRREVEKGQAGKDLKSNRDLRRGREESERNISEARKRILERRRKTQKAGIGDFIGEAALGAVKQVIPGAGAVIGKDAPVKPAKTLLERSAKDLRSFPTQAVPGAYYAGRAGVKAVKGDTKEAEKIFKEFKETSPVYNVGAAAVKAATGDTKGAGKHLKKAGKSAYEHPGFAALEVGGAAGTAGRVAGTAARAGGKATQAAGKATKVKSVERAGEKVKRAASTERESAGVPGTGLVEKRTYSKSLPVQAVQKRREKKLVRKAESKRTEARRVEKSDPEGAAELRTRADKQDPRVLSGRAVRKRVDEEVGLSEGIRRSRRARVTKQAKKILKESDSPVVTLRAQGIVRAHVDDLRAYHKELKGQEKGLTGARLQANRRTQKQIEKAIKKPAKLAKVEGAAARYRGLTKPMQEELVKRGVITRAESEAALVPYAVRRMGAKHDPESGKLTVKGKELPAAQIRAHMKEAGEPEPAYVSQAPGQRGAKNFFVSSDKPVSVPRQRRTGEATRKGTFDTDPEVLVETAARSRGLGDAQEGFSRFVSTFAHKGKSGKPRAFQSRKQAENAARDVQATTGNRVRPVRINPFLGRSEQLKALMDEVDPEQFESHPAVKEAFESAVRGEDGPGPWTLVPEEAADQLQQHVSMLGGGAGKKAVQSLNQVFRRAVLATSVNWLAGNVSEATTRAALIRAGPRSLYTGRKVLKEVEKKNAQAAEELAHRAVSGGHFSAAEAQMLKRGAEQFAGSKLEKPAKAFEAFFRAPGPKQLRGAWHLYTRAVFQHINGTFERGVQTAMLGRAVRGSDLMSDRLFKLSSKAMDEAANGLLKTENQVQMAREVRRAYGRYSDYSPTQRAALTLYSPFGAWFVNSVYFVTRTLPMDHPTVTALIADMELLSEEWRKEYGLELYAQGAVPGFLQGSIPIGDPKDRKFLRAPMKHLPFGAWQDPLNSGADLILPQIGAALKAAQGKDWRGETMYKRDPKEGYTREGKPKTRELNEQERAWETVKALAKSTIPVLSPATRASEEDIETVLNPFKVTQSKPKKAKKKSGFAKPSKGGGFVTGGSKGGFVQP